jgi:hypothetical protein
MQVEVVEVLTIHRMLVELEEMVAVEILEVILEVFLEYLEQQIEVVAVALVLTDLDIATLVVVVDQVSVF